MDGTTFLIVAALGIAALVVFLFTKKKMIAKKHTKSTCGEKAYPGGTLDPQAWYTKLVLYPHIDKSPGMPLHPAKAQGEPGFYFDFPVGVGLPLKTGGRVGYVTFKHGSLAGKKVIKMRYRIDHDPETLIYAVPEENPESQVRSRLTMYFQREGDNWFSQGEYEAYRWWNQKYNTYVYPGEHELVVPLDDGWGAILTSGMDTNPKGFQDAINNACCLGFVFGGNEVGIGHGARATGPARFTLLEFTVE